MSGGSPIRSWPIVRREELLATSVFTVHSRIAVSPRTGQEHEFFLIAAPDWVNVIACPDPDHILMIKQYRHGSEEVTLEIPGGVVDQSDAGPAETAMRELLEETGYRAATLRLLGSVCPNPALQGNSCHTYVATDLSPMEGGPQLDGAEDIELVRVPLRDIPELLGRGAITHALVVAALYRYMLPATSSSEPSGTVL